MSDYRQDPFYHSCQPSSSHVMISAYLVEPWLPISEILWILCQEQRKSPRRPPPDKVRTSVKATLIPLSNAVQTKADVKERPILSVRMKE